MNQNIHAPIVTTIRATVVISIFHISQENLKQCMAWSNDIPPNVDPDEHVTQSIELCKIASSGDDKNTDKIIKNISKEIQLNKQVINEL